MRPVGALEKLVLDRESALIARWRKRLHQLQAEEWEFEDTPWPERIDRRYSTMRNCRPTFIVPKLRDSKACRASTLCPFCWARWVGDVYESVAWALLDAPERRFYSKRTTRRADATVDKAPAPSPKGHKPSRSSFDLIERMTRLPSHVSRFTIGREEARRAYATSGVVVDPRARRLPSLIKARVKGSTSGVHQYGRPAEFARCRVFGVLGAYEHMSIGVVEKKISKEDGSRVLGAARWDIVFRHLFMVPSDWDDARPEVRAWLDDPALEPGLRGKYSGKWRRVKNPERKGIATLVGRCCTYDTMLLNADARRVREVLDARKGFRLSVSFGAFRNGVSWRGVEVEEARVTWQARAA